MYVVYISLILYHGSMQPTININDVIIVKDCDIKELKIDDIITFNKDKKIISHRIIKKIEKNDKFFFLTQGDNNNIEDKGLIEEKQIYGKVIFKIPKVGIIVRLLQNKKGFMQIAIFVIIIFVLISMKSEEKNRRKILRKKYEIKKEREKYK